MNTFNGCSKPIFLSEWKHKRGFALWSIVTQMQQSIKGRHDIKTAFYWQLVRRLWYCQTSDFRRNNAGSFQVVWCSRIYGSLPNMLFFFLESGEAIRLCQLMLWEWCCSTMRSRAFCEALLGTCMIRAVDLFTLPAVISTLAALCHVVFIEPGPSMCAGPVGNRVELLGLASVPPMLRQCFWTEKKWRALSGLVEILCLTWRSWSISAGRSLHFLHWSFAVPDNGARLKGRILELPVDLCSSPLVIWLMTNNGRKNESTSFQMIFHHWVTGLTVRHTVSLGESDETWRVNFDSNDGERQISCSNN